MYLESLRLYFIEGLKTRDIAQQLNISDAKVRGLLGSQGLRIREVGLNLRDSGREPVCAAVTWKGYKSFHEFIGEFGLKPISEQAATLGVSKKSFTRIYDIYRLLLEQLQAADRDINEPIEPRSYRRTDRRECTEI